jgi:predicted pyridoxine 5'-phosphate oxidase superfamily flavin-nucleotide-binding protein
LVSEQDTDPIEQPAIPERPGNHRCDTLQNILERPGVGLIFLVPGRAETLRICGHAVVVRDREMRECLALGGRLPELVTVVAIERAFFTARDAFDTPSCGKSAAFLDSVSLSELRTAELCADVLAGAASGDSALTH